MSCPKSLKFILFNANFELPKDRMDAMTITNISQEFNVYSIQSHFLKAQSLETV